MQIAIATQAQAQQVDVCSKFDRVSLSYVPGVPKSIERDCTSRPDV